MEKYRRATEIMKNLPITNPHCFVRQANIHCSYCTGAFKEENYDDMLLRIHRSRLFFPFHRAYLYFYERIVGKIMGDDSFAIPYWNWDVPEGMYMPDMFMNESLFHQKRETTHFPPRVTENDFHKSDKFLGPEKQIEANLALMYVQMVSGAKTPELFMGCPLKAGHDGWCMRSGTIEMSPHNSLHSWTGITSLREHEDMGAFYAAARDPLFYPHHSNIDRLWHVWRELNDVKEEWSDPEWFNSFFYFYDENQQLIRVRVSDMLDETKLGYRYVPSETFWLDYKPTPLVEPNLAKKELSKLNNGHNTPLFGSNIRRLDTTFTVKVPRSIKPVAEEEMKDGKKIHTEEILEVDGILAEENVAVKFDVFINMVNESMAIKSDVRVREYAGAFQTMGGGKKINAKKVGKIDDIRI
ncbi:Catechol oxidase [Zostera marina]|uniref:Catechol oxidase n=1 Tax=Zostera marina TaxID=29655 RepID=A0A0K9PS79_ZOSMR|nr:Catechol oxidase [Zostera marina]